VPLYPFFSARLSPGPLHYRRDADMSIVFVQGGGLSQDQFDRVSLNRTRFLPVLAGWIAALSRNRAAKTDQT
jgi:hypothetical protein